MNEDRTTSLGGVNNPNHIVFIFFLSNLVLELSSFITRANIEINSK
jgi:hypothetical protein